MTVAELIKELKGYRKDMNVTIPTSMDWENDEDGNVTNIKDVDGVFKQRFIDTQGWGIQDIEELMIY